MFFNFILLFFIWKKKEYRKNKKIDIDDLVYQSTSTFPLIRFPYGRLPRLHISINLREIEIAESLKISINRVFITQRIRLIFLV